MQISRAFAYQVFDSRGLPTIAVRLESGNSYAVGMSPSGASTGSYEVFEMRDNEVAFQGRGVLHAVHHFNTALVPLILEQACVDQKAFDSLLIASDGSHDFSVIGGNTAIAASIAYLRLFAAVHHKEPYEVLAQTWGYQIDAGHCITPMVNLINGGKHASSGLVIQEVMIVPVVGTTTKEKIYCGAEVFSALKAVLAEKQISTLVGDEGGFAPKITHLEEAVDLIRLACLKVGLVFGTDIKLALDCAASELYRNGKYHLEGTDFEAQELVSFYSKAIQDFHIISIEDPFAEDDFVAWELFRDSGVLVDVVGDDLTVTNTERMKMAQSKKLISAMIVKPNQIGTISQTMDAIDLAFLYGWKPILSHRSGETEDTTIADIAYAVGAPYIKTGSMSRSERLAKYNRLLGIGI